MPAKGKKTAIQALHSLMTHAVLLGSGNMMVAQMGTIKINMVLINTNPPQMVKTLPNIFFIISVFLDEPVDRLFAMFRKIFV